jgi:hypothetical protein
VSEFGVGEEVQMNLFGWRDDELVIVAQIDIGWGDMDDAEERIDRTAQAAQALRHGWACDAFTLLSEGYVSRKPRKTSRRDLGEQFAEGEPEVDECLSIIHVEDQGDEVRVCAQPFEVLLGKQVEFGPLLHSEDPSLVRNEGYVEALSEMLTTPAIKKCDDWDRLRLEIAMTIADNAGWYIQYDI